MNVIAVNGSLINPNPESFSEVVDDIIDLMLISWSKKTIATHRPGTTKYEVNGIF